MKTKTVEYRVQFYLPAERCWASWGRGQENLIAARALRAESMDDDRADIGKPRKHRILRVETVEQTRVIE